MPPVAHEAPTELIGQEQPHAWHRAAVIAETADEIFGC